MNSTEQAAEMLVSAFINRQLLLELPKSCRPNNVQEAFACQDLFVETLLEKFGGTTIGYKIAGLSNRHQQILKVSQPFYGQLLSVRTEMSPAKLCSKDFSMRISEPEYAFELSEDLPPRNAGYEVSEVRKAVKNVFAAIEIVDSRYSNWTQVDELSMIADNALAATWVKGIKKLTLDAVDIVNQDIHFYVNGILHSKGSGSLVLGDPLIALTWLANALNHNGRFLKTGDLVISGSVANVYSAQSGDIVAADFGDLGVVQVEFD